MDTPARLLDVVVAADVAVDDPEPVRAEVVVEVLHAPARKVVQDHDVAQAPVQDGVHDVAADESGATGYQPAHVSLLRLPEGGQRSCVRFSSHRSGARRTTGRAAPCRCAGGCPPPGSTGPP